VIWDKKRLGSAGFFFALSVCAYAASSLLPIPLVLDFLESNDAQRVRLSNAPGVRHPPTPQRPG
jgi:hypothetical protein